jgi:hypothetical protein
MCAHDPEVDGSESRPYQGATKADGRMPEAVFLC